MLLINNNNKHDDTNIGVCSRDIEHIVGWMGDEYKVLLWKSAIW